MPYPFVLPTTSAFAFSNAFACDSHPSLPLSASTYRGVVRDALKKHKRLAASAQSSHLAVVVSSIEAYLPYLLAIDAGLARRPAGSCTTNQNITVAIKNALLIEWRPTLSGEVVPGRERTRVKVASLEHEVFFTLSTLAFAHGATARACLQPLYSTTGSILSTPQRTTAITTATRHLLEVASIYDHLGRRGDVVATPGPPPPPCVDVSPSTARALSSLALAEATLLAILKDDPYPAAVAQDRNVNDTEWMYKAPDIPKVRAHLFARLALAASEHAAQALALCHGAAAAPGVNSRVSAGLVRYVEDLRRTSRAKACRFFGIDAELGGETADGIGWARAGLQELGVDVAERGKKSGGGGGLGLGRLKKEFKERREDRRVDGDGAAWGSDAGKLEETRILELLDAKWSKINDTMNTKAVPPPATLLPKMPSGRDVHTIKPYVPPALGADVLEAMRAPPAHEDNQDGDLSSDADEPGPSNPPGAYPGADYSGGRATGSSYY
ncbi:BRO1 domain protein [Cordyceps fumosorosea ARSEF 2679]|uniref:pH-response regulator protein palC n=1 Tax=Cordyceps fumosorosea (strain ARSEF 2679) TaxID=1081104 RepID=A0A168CGE6_CORFA|nr:BRO1 domain protein [Cordyceps fumosorosea ARSEF 2679]OAA71343.1 BRO1 domain protein [Cordyceps fumosorosea ARSEF 2679]